MKYPLLSIFVLASNLYSDQLTPNYNPSGRFETKNNTNVFMSVEGLVFKFCSDASPYAYSSKIIAPHNIDTYAISSPYEWGFRICGGYNISHDKWDLIATYTRFANSNTSIIEDNLNSNLSAYYNNSETEVAPFSDVTNTWKINYNLLDLEQGRQFFISKHLRIRPKIGLRNLWLYNSQKVNAEYINNYATNARSIFWGMGILGGVDTIWHLSSNFSLYGNLSVSCLFGSINPKTDVSDLTTNIITRYQSHKNQQTKGNVDLAIGVRWDKNFYDNRFHISFNAGFEQHIYFNMAQNFFTASLYETYSGSSGRDFTLSGFSLGSRFDY